MSNMIAVAARDTAVAAAKVMFPDDPVAAALATTEALTAVIKTTLPGTVDAGGQNAASSTPSGYQSKLAQEIVLAGTMANRTDDGKWSSDREKSTLFKNARVDAPFSWNSVQDAT